MTKESDWFNSLRSNEVVNQANLEYRIQTLAMRQLIQRGKEANLDPNHPMDLRFYIPPTTTEVKYMTLRFEFMSYTSHLTIKDTVATTAPIETSTAFWQSGTTDSSSTVTASDGSTVTLKRHTHFTETPRHTHTTVPEITDHTLPLDVRIAINGQDKTDQLGGPFNFTGTPFELDITPYVQKNGRNVVSFSTSRAGRIDAEVIGEIYVP